MKKKSLSVLIIGLVSVIILEGCGLNAQLPIDIIKRDNPVKKIASNISSNKELIDTINGNYTNWGTACSDGEYIYFSDVNTQIYCAKTEERLSFFPIRGGVYFDLGILGDELIATKSVGTGDEYKEILVKIDPSIGEDETIEEFDALQGMLIVDERYYFITGDNDKLYYLTADGEIHSTKYKNVVGMSEYGVFMSTDDGYGLKYKTFNGDETKKFSKFNDTRCWIINANKKSALVGASYPEENRTVIYELLFDMKKESYNRLEVISSDMFDDYYSGLQANVTDDYYIFSYISVNEDGQKVPLMMQMKKGTDDCERLGRMEPNEDAQVVTSSIIGNKVLSCQPMSNTNEYEILEIR